MADAQSPRVLSQLIGSIYDSALDPTRWEQTLLDLRQAFDAQVAMLALMDHLQRRILIHRTVGMEPTWLKELERHVPEIDQIVGTFRALHALDEPYIISRHLPPAYIETSPYLQECLRPQGIVDILQHWLIDTNARYSVFAISKNERQGLITEREIEVARLLLPHVRRAVTISNVLEARTIERARMAEALDALRCVVLLADAGGAILHANDAGEQMLRAGSLIKVVGGTLRAMSSTAGAELRSAIALAARDETGIGKTGLAVRMSDPEEPPVFAHVLPLTGSDFRTRLQPAAVAAIFIRTRSDEQETADHMSAAFGLTPAETRVLANLLGGSTRTQAAAALGIAPTTAKSHLENIYAKTGVARQADLMRLAAGLVPPTRSKL